VVGQTVLSVLLIIASARLFVSQIVSIAEQLYGSATLLTLVIAPIATELPETLNSVVWIRQGKDTLAFGNITGAMLFQSCVPVASGIAFTTYTLGLVELFCAALADSGSLALRDCCQCEADGTGTLLKRDRLKPVLVYRAYGLAI
jgi:cation:H+ antiporter